MTTLRLPRRPLVDAVTSSSHGDYVRAEHTPGLFQVTGSDGVVTTATWLLCHDATTQSGADEVTVPAKLLASTVKSLSGDDVEVVIATSRLSLSGDARRGDVVAGGRVVGLQSVPDEAWVEVLVDEAAKLRSALLAAAPAMLLDTSRPAVSGVRFNDGAVVAQDGARLHCTWLPHGLGSFTLPGAGVSAVADALMVEVAKPTKLPKPRKGVAVVLANTDVPTPPRLRVAVGQNFVAVEVCDSSPTAPCPRRLVVVRRAPEPYSQWRRVLEGLGDDAVATVQWDVLVGALKGCPGDAVTLTWATNTSLLRLDYVVMDDTSTRRLGSGDVEVVAQCLGTGSVKVATRLLLDAVKCCGDEVVLSVSQGQPLRVRSGDFEAIVMWMR